MDQQFVRFNRQNKPEFFKELRKRVNGYFKENEISKHANWAMRIKTAVMILAYFLPLILMLAGVITGTWAVLAAWVVMSLGMCGIGTSVMHDANHGAYSKNKYVNQFFGFLSNFLGAYHINWKIQHNVLHHTYTNIDGHDGDIANPAMRFTPTQERKWFNRFQVFYAPFLYGLMTLYWSLAKDFEALNRYGKEGLIKTQNMSPAAAWTQLIFNKTWYFLLTLVLPLILVDVSWYITVIGFVIMHFICGSLLAYIFQTAHVIEETDFFMPAETGSMENSWAIHQLMTTANFADKSKVFSWFIGGLNYQIEHHLFPNICHIHYKKISKIVKQTALEYNIPYYEHRTFLQALSSHFKLLNALGTGSYDKKLAA